MNANRLATYQLLSLLHVGTLQPSNDGDAQTHILHDIDQTPGDSIAADDTAENVNEDGSDFWVAGDELKSRLDSGGGSTTTNVEEVGGVSAVELDDIHGGHGETSTVD